MLTSSMLAVWQVKKKKKNNNYILWVGRYRLCVKEQGQSSMFIVSHGIALVELVCPQYLSFFTVSNMTILCHI